MDRAERRRQERAEKKGRPILIGQGVVATPGDQQFEAKPMAQLPDKVPGKHRWMAIASYIVSPEQAESAMDADTPKFLDHENMFDIAIGCWDCEQPLPSVGVDSTCPAKAWEP